MIVRWILVGLIATTLSGCSWSTQPSGVEILSNPTAKIFINGKDAGMTPYKNNSLKPGITQIKLLVSDHEWVRNIKLQAGANTVINREFIKNSKESGGYVLYFEPTGNNNKAGLLINATPNKAAISVDDEILGYSPMRSVEAGEGDKRLVVSFPGYKSVSSFVKLINGYQLVAEVDLTKEDDRPTVVEPTPTVVIKTVTVQIKQTETGWLRVRSQPDANATEISKVKVGESFQLLEEKSGWYKVDLGSSVEGWVSSKYADKVTL